MTGADRRIQLVVAKKADVGDFSVAEPDLSSFEGCGIEKMVQEIGSKKALGAAASAFLAMEFRWRRAQSQQQNQSSFFCRQCHSSK